MEKLFTWEQTEKTETGLDVLIKYGEQWIAWTYDAQNAEKIVNALNGAATFQNSLEALKEQNDIYVGERNRALGREKTWRESYEALVEEAKQNRRDAQKFYGALQKIAKYHGTTDEVWANNMRAIAKEALEDTPNDV